MSSDEDNDIDDVTDRMSALSPASTSSLRGSQLKRKYLFMILKRCIHSDHVLDIYRSLENSEDVNVERAIIRIADYSKILGVSSITSKFTRDELDNFVITLMLHGEPAADGGMKPPRKATPKKTE